MALYAVIMAGGVGSRFWPRSRRANPKQFLDVLSPASLIQNTFERVRPAVPPERIFVVTHADYADKTREHLPEMPPENVLAEPVARNTAPCIAFAATRLHALDPDAVVAVLPADHLIRQPDRFVEVLLAAAEKAEEGGAGAGALVTIGIEPTHPETGYGYIQFDASARDDDDETPRAYRVLAFAEKPDVSTAERFLDSGDFLWNSGMFIWRADAILAALAKYLPEVAAAFAPVEAAFAAGNADAAVRAAYSHTPKISIDYGVMEKAASDGQVFVVPGNFGWNDVGDWRAVYELAEKDAAGNAAEGTVITHGSSRTYARASDGRLLVLVGVRDLAVVDTGDAVLVCHLDLAQQVKDIVDYLGAHGMDHHV
jgi:mannose-1-phosphate guanylyltransferase